MKGLETGTITDALADLVLHMPGKRAYEIQSYEHHYFTDLRNEYDFLQSLPYANKFPKPDKMIFEQLRKRINPEEFLTNKADSEIKRSAIRLY